MSIIKKNTNLDRIVKKTTETELPQFIFKVSTR